MPSPAADHRAHAPSRVACFVLSISDSRTADADTSGDTIAALLTDAGHTVSGRRLVRDEPEQIAAIVAAEARRGGSRAIITTGGTGLSSRDSTYEALAALIEKPMVGFGELFRMLSFEEIGAAAMLSRATAGVVSGAIVFVLPGSEHAVRLAMTRLILPELGHIVRELSR